VTGGREAVRILGIDPGSRITGYGIVDFRGNHLTHVASGRIQVLGEGLPARLGHIFEALGEVLETHEPHEMAVEQVFMHRNADSALKLGQARGAAILAGVTRGLPVAEYMPNQIKQAVTGRGHAEKGQVQQMMKILLCLAQPPASDAADALAVAVCHGHMRQTALRLEGATGW
jgi:crossover junction endodeoxyribonuclease RuvC